MIVRRLGMGEGKECTRNLLTIPVNFFVNLKLLKNNILTDNNKNRIHPIILLSELSGRSSWLTLLPQFQTQAAPLVNII